MLASGLFYWSNGFRDAVPGRGGEWRWTCVRCGQEHCVQYARGERPNDREFMLDHIKNQRCLGCGSM